MTFSRRSLLLSLLDHDHFAQVDLFREGDAGVHTYRIPALIETRRKVLVAIADARQDSDRDLPARISLVMRRSFDHGRTWSDPQTIRSVGEGGVGDPSLLLDRKTGRLWCFHIYGGPGVGFNTPLSKQMQWHAMHSEDDGGHWSTPVNLTPQVMDPSWEAMFATSGTHFQLKSGRLLVPMVVRDGNHVISSRNAYSDDHGEHWKIGAAIGPKTDESKAVELADGTVLQNMRYTKRRAIARSHDGGITFDPITTDEALPDAVCNAGLVRHRGGALVFSNAASDKRERLTVRVSHDDGRSWPVSRVVHEGPAAYSTLIAMSDGSIGMLYERGERRSVEKITFAKFRI